MEITPALARDIKELVGHFRWLRQTPNPITSKKWVKYEEARKILHKSPKWYVNARLGYKKADGQFVDPILIRGQDWKKEGKEVIYNPVSLERLREEITK